MKGETMNYAIFVMLLLLPGIVFAHGEEDFAAAEDIIAQKIPCDDLSGDELEIIGDYYMEQMHPGEAHERMDEMMGGEGSESLRQMHINMARSFYCGEHDSMGPQNMRTMMGYNGMGPGMMHDSQESMMSYSASWTPLNTLLALAMVVLFFWGTYALMKRR